MDISLLWSKPWNPDIGFTGTREGMTYRQYIMLRTMLEVLQPGNVHHGDCIGSDKQAHAAALLATKATMHVHPGHWQPKASEVAQPFRAYCQGDITYPSRPFLVRNKDIVNATDITIATPKEAQPVLRSGTWSTIRYSMGNLKPTVLIQPDGTTVFFDGERIIMKTNVVSLYNGAATPVATWTDNSTGTAIPIHESASGYFGFYYQGTWDSGSAKLQVSPDDSGTVWHDVTGATALTANGYKIVQVFGRRLRVVLASVAAAGASLTFKVAGVQTGVTVTNS